MAVSFPFTINNMALTTLSLPALQKTSIAITSPVGAFTIGPTMPSLTTISAGAVISHGGTVVMGSMAALTDLTGFWTSGTLKSVNGNITMSANALTAASVNHILSVVASLDGTSGTTSWGTGKTLLLNGGTNAAPTGQGITDKATIIARGATVTTN